ncbi:hypothetical protein V8G54_011197 [Vigna mungo]|uniref:Uncharacterized protein n=1 Tax=Vigna mungo TaxID=3915 RepID=A0AAQ3NP74_VIGMU
MPGTLDDKRYSTYLKNKQIWERLCVSARSWDLGNFELLWVCQPTQEEEAVSSAAVRFALMECPLSALTLNTSQTTPFHPPALALGDPSVTLEEVTPPVFSSGPLFPIEDRIVQLFERNTYSVVNIFDVTLRPQLNITGVVEIPEGNGSGVVWDEEGHIVTNYHGENQAGTTLYVNGLRFLECGSGLSPVLDQIQLTACFGMLVGNALSKNPKAGEVVARVNILASERLQKNFEGVLIGADRLKDLAVDAPKDILRPIKVGQSSSLKVGQQCLAIGNPFGFDHTLTVGVISGLNRDIFSQTGVTIGGGVQTDAAINPGNRLH